MFLGKLYPFQVEGAEFLVNKKRAALLFEQGLGKTITALAAFERLKELGKAKNCLIVGQAGYLFQWENAINAFTDSTYTLCDNRDARRSFHHSTDYTLVSYNIYRNDFPKILLVKYDVKICDEAQEFANNKSKTAHLVKSYNRIQDPTYRWALTGTAIRSKLEHLYSIMFWVDKTFLPSWPAFEKKHIVRDERTKQIVSYKNLIPLFEYLKYRVHRATHKDVEGSIPRIVGPVFHTITPSKEYTEAQHHLLETLDRLSQDININDFIHPRTKSEVSKAFNRCKKLLSGEDKVKYLTKEIEKVLEENPDNRVVVFSYYKDPLYLLDKHLKQRSIESVRFTGDEKAETKKKNIGVFSTDVRVLLASNAGYKGLDLPYANYIFHIDIPLSFEVLDQRNKRITRLSSTHKTVVVNYLITERSIEQYYFSIVLKQGELLKATFDEAKDVVQIRTQTLRQYLDGYRRKDTQRLLSTEESTSSSRTKTEQIKQEDKRRTRARRTSNRKV